MIGLIVNPIAGMGGRIGLKGSDGDRAAQAASAGAVARAGTRTTTALEGLLPFADRLELLACSGAMGEDAAVSAGLSAAVLYRPEEPGRTTAGDTAEAARIIANREPDLLLFAGGDGTARDLVQAIGDAVPVLGIPAGVKMHSSVFAASPRAAGEVAYRFLLSSERADMLDVAEVLDRETDSEAPTIFGSLVTPRLNELVPGAKAASRLSDRAALAAALERTHRLIDDHRINLLGPGTTMLSLKRLLGFEGSLLGVDAVRRGEVAGVDLGEGDILDFIAGEASRIVVTVVGGQGFLFGRGNQPLSPAVIREVGIDNIVVVASQEKLAGLPGNCLLVDTGDAELDRDLSGYLPVLVSSRRSVMMPVRNTAAS